MKYTYYIGADVSKLTLDLTILKEGEFLLHEKISNSGRDIRNWLNKIMSHYRVGGKKTLFCVENSGVYTMPLVNELDRKKSSLWLESAAQIKLSIGLQRGKSDKVDSNRIANYAYTFRDKIVLWHRPRQIIDELRKLRSLREKLLNVRRMLSTGLKEQIGFVDKNSTARISRYSQKTLSAIDSDLKNVNGAMLELIETDSRLRQIFNWIKSIPSVGNVLSTELLIATNEFKNFTNPKKFACYCGVAPFRYTSGTSLQSKARISKKANHRMRSLLHMAAICSLRCKGDLKKYFDRRVTMGVHKMNIINVIRNKIISRVFACVREGRPYVENL